MPAPDLAAAKAYLGAASSYPDADVSNALAAEKAAQASVCRVDPDLWPDDLREALLRRVARNLAMQSLPLGAQPSISEAGVGTFRPGLDSEIRRLEAPYRRVKVG